MSNKSKMVDQREPRDIKNPKETVLNWLKKCEDTDTKPWEYDFKYEIYKNTERIKNKLKETNERKHIELLLETWQDDKAFGYVMETEDSDLAQCIYKILWGSHSKNATKSKGDVDADVMNSFWYTFKYYLRSVDKNEVFIKNGFNRNAPTKSAKELTDDEKEEFKCKYGCEYGGKFKLEKTLISGEKFWLTFVLENMDVFLKGKSEVVTELDKYAKLTHTIGNFTLVTKGFNSGRGGDDYWDHALKEMKNQTQVLFGGGFEHYVDKFFMSGDDIDYVKNGEVEPWITRSEKGKIESFLKKVNPKIEARGKKIIKELLEKLEKQVADADKERLSSYKEELFKCESNC